MPIWVELDFLEFQLHWSRLPLIYGVWHPYKHMITMLYRNFMPIISLI